MPEESQPHEGTWLQWPHHYQYGLEYRNDLDATWVAMTAALVSGENVHVVAYNKKEQERITGLLESEGISLDHVDFYLMRTDDVWVRDNGPIYVRDQDGELVVQDWGFNGWGQKTDDYSGLPIRFENCDNIPKQIADYQQLKYLDLNTTLINEGGSVILDGNGTMLACKSSILNRNRNPGMTQLEIDSIFKRYLGVSQVIWLDGKAGNDITDQHIDGFATFGNSGTIVTMKEADLLAFDVRPRDIKKLYHARNKEGNPYSYLLVPLTKNTVKKTDGTDLGYKGSYINYYIGNEVVLVPNYEDPNDEIANEIIQSIYPKRSVIGIDVRNLYANGGMVHCVTQQQPK
ncbi:MAG: agmatine deiminase family protein [Ekhidna sp.]|nr:agmatine deiminase family protein [Ekhidna sp.]